MRSFILAVLSVFTAALVFSDVVYFSSVFSSVFDNSLQTLSLIALKLVLTFGLLYEVFVVHRRGKKKMEGQEQMILLIVGACMFIGYLLLSAPVQ